MRTHDWHAAEPGASSALLNTRRDLVTGGITVAAMLMFVGTAAPVVSGAVARLFGSGAGADRLLTTALILNVALVLFGWRRTADIQSEVRDRALAEARSVLLASTDPLTGFLNRRALAGEGARVVAKAGSARRKTALLMLDVDDFRTVNDLHGHAVGDAALMAVADVVRDLVPAGAVVARLGGDEFACVLVTDDSGDDVDRLADRMVAAVAQPLPAAGRTLHLTASVGLALSGAGAETMEALMRRADIALSVSKQRGRRRHGWFDPTMERELRARSDIEAGIRVGIPTGQFVPFYEQQVDLATGRVQGFEMLARWHHPELGLVGPDMFIAIAEQTGLIGALSLSVMRQAFEDARDWDPALSLSVNISPAQMRDPWLAQKIVKLLVETGFQAHRLEIEITEGALVDNLALARSIVGSLKNQGIRIALDDFGTGYSSLSNLRALPFDRIKIDRSFVSSIGEKEDGAALANAIARLGDSLGLPITAEGIGTDPVEAQVRAAGTADGQGWRFGKPVDANDVRTMLAARGLLVARGMDNGGHDHAQEPRRMAG